MKFSLYHTYERIFDSLLDNEGRTRWDITQQVINVDYRRMKNLLDILVKSGNLSFDKEVLRYSISDKGRKTLKVIKSFNEKYGFLVSPEIKKHR